MITSWCKGHCRNVCDVELHPMHTSDPFCLTTRTQRTFHGARNSFAVRVGARRVRARRMRVVTAQPHLVREHCARMCPASPQRKQMVLGRLKLTNALMSRLFTER